MIDFRDRLLAGLGGAWPEPCDLAAQWHETTPRNGCRIERVSYLVEPGERVATLVLVPDGATQQDPRPALCVWHQHAGQYHLGKTEPAGLAGNPMHHTGAALAREGYVVICPDALGFEERQTGQLKAGELERFLFLRYLVSGKTLAWKNILDMRRAVDYACQRDDVDRERIGCYGHSMGSTHCWLVAPWEPREPRLKAVACNCCLPTYAGIHREEILHCFPNFIPGIFEYGDTPDIVALIAPRSLHMNFGELDGGTPIADVPPAMQRIARTYESVHAEDRFSYYIEQGSGHVLSEEMWRRVREFFTRNLRGQIG